MNSRKTVLLLLILLASALLFIGPGRSTTVIAQNSGPSANGHGNLTTVGGALRTFSFHARTEKDGTVKGEVTLHNRRTDTFVKVDIDCLHVVGNIATMSGTVTHSDDPTLDFTGWHSIFRVVDNGEGADSPPDLMTGLANNPPEVTVTCTDIFTEPLRVIEAGNIQVKP